MPFRSRPLLLVATLTLVACDAGSPLAAQLQACDLLSEGEVGPWLLDRFYTPTPCYEACLASAECEELGELLCGGALELRRRCDQRCAFRCPDGSLIGVEQQCDGFPQCEGGADEAGCAMWSCRSGDTVPLRGRCDRWTHCADGSDEEGCDYERTCDGGRRLSQWEICDGSVSCSDGADEQGCAELRCADGQVVTLRMGSVGRCDGWTQCRDGSDEEGCASFQGMCR